MLVGFSWRNADEQKMVSTFGMGCADFGCFVDLQVRSCSAVGRAAWHACVTFHME